MKKNLIFDLDGTLIDSAPSILGSYYYAFDQMGITPLQPLNNDIIGPPLMETLFQLTGGADVMELQQLANYFKAHYDLEGYKKATVYKGIQLLLAGLKQSNFKIYFATNKRYYPTKKIIKYLDWEDLVTDVFALDYRAPAFASKSMLLAHLIADVPFNRNESIYIGDRYEDGLASDENQLDFVMVTWGYLQAATKIKPHWQQCQQVSDLRDMFAAKNR